MVFNPSVELYLISPDGELLADAAPPGHIKRQRVDIVPIQTFLSGGAWPVYGDDPRSEDQRKVFSVAPLNVDGQLRGYLYIILQGETFNELAASAAEDVGKPAYLDAAAGGPVWSAGRRPCLVLGDAPGTPADRTGGGEKTALERLNCWRRKRRIRIPAMKWRSCITGLSTWPGRSPGSGIDWPIAIASGVNLSPIFLTICGLH